MKEWMLAVLLLAFSSCTKEKTVPIPFNEPFTMSADQKLCVDDNSFCLVMDRVAADSRCPSTAICIWQGVAEINFTLIKNGTTYSFSLYTTEWQQYYTDTTVAGYNFKLQNLTPYPERLKPIAQKDYKAEIIIRK